MAFARETPRLHFNAIEPGLNPTTGLGGADVGAFMRFLQRRIIPLFVPLLRPFIKILSTPKRAVRVITKILIDASGQTGVYYDEKRRSDARLRARARPEVPGSRRRRDARLPVEGSDMNHRINAATSPAIRHSHR